MPTLTHTSDGVRAGAMRQVFTFLQNLGKSGPQTSTGGFTANWQPVPTASAVRAYVEGQPRSIGPEKVILGQQMTAQVRYRAVIRWRQDIDRTMRVLWRNVTYQIFAMSDPDGRSRWLALDLQATE